VTAVMVSFFSVVDIFWGIPIWKVNIIARLLVIVCGVT
jgi:hypothetical protein